MLSLAAKQPQISVVNDQRGSPTYVVDLARAMYELCDKGARGIVHATNAGDCTWFDFAGEVFRQAGLRVDVLPTTSDKFPRPATRPSYSVLSKESLESWGGRDAGMARWFAPLPGRTHRRGVADYSAPGFIEVFTMVALCSLPLASRM